MDRRLTLAREPLAELTADDLASVVGAAPNSLLCLLEPPRSYRVCLA